MRGNAVGFALGSIIGEEMAPFACAAVLDKIVLRAGSAERASVAGVPATVPIGGVLCFASSVGFCNKGAAEGMLGGGRWNVER